MDEEKIKIDVSKLREKIGVLELDVKLEGHDDQIAAEILVRLLEKRPVSDEQINFLKEQSIDFAKVLALIGLQAIPGSSIAIIFLEKAAEKYGFSFLPKPNRKIPDMK
jgi:hypothetical protein